MKPEVKVIEAIQIKIILNRTNPLIWRELLVPRDITFYKLHHTIQIAMGWTNSHLFEFKIEGYRIGEIYENLEEQDESHIVNAKETKLITLIDKEGEEFKYEYDFGDGWDHSIILEKYESLKSTQQLPFCKSGALKCPPEDCGGITGLYDFLSILLDKRHPDHRATKVWAGGKFDPAEFDIVKVNKQLKNIDKYIKSIEE
ncbi:MAG: plasmid pRiA4b ORF-3 family protein [Ferruginibacter sp.]